MLELYHWEPAGDSARLLILLEEKDIEFESHYVDVLEFDQYSEDHLRRSSAARVPVLATEGGYLDLPRITLDYLVEAYTPRLAPEDPRGWYEVQAWANVLDAGLAANVSLLGWNTVMLPDMSKAEREAFSERYANRPVVERLAGWSAVFSDAEANEDQLQNARVRIGEMVEKLEQVLQGSEWLVGNVYSVADMNAFALCHTLPRLTPGIVNEEKTPGMTAWLHRINERPAVKRVLGRRRHTRTEDVYAPPG
ncbi:MAG: glutathione S-transferase family protein [Gammaproteobacteria bacterium]|jgi:GST-like protein